MNPDEYPVALERHEQLLISLQAQLNDIKEVQTEIKKMNEALITLTNEMKNTNIALQGQEARLKSLEKVPLARYESIIAAVISSVVCGVIGFITAKFLI